ncbi:MAG: hypothetical protein K2L19_02705 [Eubacterium sp.]|nr:hypothetical protein [Eubacterium sp.]
MAENKKSSFSIRKLIYNDKYLIIISVVLAIVIWVTTSMNLSPETTKTITVPVSVDFTGTAAEQLGIKCFGEESVDVDVTVTCKKYLAKDITADDLNVYLQTNTVTSNGNYDVPITVEARDNSDFKITSYYPTVYRAYFDVEAEKVMDIDIRYTKEDFIEEGYTMGVPMLSESSVKIKGPNTFVTQVAEVVATVNVDENLKTTTSMDITPVALDANGSKVSYIKLETVSNNLTVTIPVLKEMELDVATNFVGKPGKINISDFDVSYSVNRVSAGVLEDANITQAVIGNIDFSKLRPGENKFTFNVESLDSLVILDSIDEIEASVTVPDDYIEKTLWVNVNNVTVSNVPDSYNAKATALSSYSITLVGREEDLENISAANIKLTVDLSSLNKDDDIKTGISSYPVSAVIDNSDTCWVYGDYTASVNITKA